MKKISILFFIMLIFISCSGQTKYGEPEVNPIAIQSKFMDWWSYHYKNIMLSRDFVALDITSKEISKEAFLK